MEKRLFLTVLAVFVFLSSFIFAQNLTQTDKVQILLWAEKEAYPGINWQEGKIDWAEQKDEDNPYALPVSRLKKTGPFFIEGMLYGWKVEYTPYDKTRV